MIDIPYTDERLRVSSAQRERAIELVRQAAADGRLDFDEMNSRVTVGLEARTQGELRRIVGDLVPSADLAAFLTDVTPPLEGPGSTWDNPMVIGRDNRWDVKGEWNVPPFLEVYCSFWRTLTMSFLEATALAPVIDLVVVAHTGTLTVVVPPGWGVDTERISVSSQGGFSSNVATRPDKGFPRIVMRGHVSNGRARYAKPRELRKLAEGRAAAELSRAATPAIGT